MTLDLRPTLDRLGVSLRDLARGSGMSLGAAHNLAAAGELPRRSADAVRNRVVAYLKTRGATPADLGGLLLPRPQKIPRQFVVLPGHSLTQPTTTKPRRTLCYCKTPI